MSWVVGLFISPSDNQCVYTHCSNLLTVDPHIQCGPKVRLLDLTVYVDAEHTADQELDFSSIPDLFWKDGSLI